MMSSFKDPDRFDIYDILQDRVPWDDKILLPYGLHLFIVQKPAASGWLNATAATNSATTTRTGNWARSSARHRRASQEIYPAMMHATPDWMELREFYCPGCQALLEVEAVPPGYPIVFDFLPDLETFYRDWLGRDLPG